VQGYRRCLTGLRAKGCVAEGLTVRGAVRSVPYSLTAL
jgi:hypothetical protein